MAASLDTKRAALHDISNKGASLAGVDKVREPRAARAMGLSSVPCASTPVPALRHMPPS